MGVVLVIAFLATQRLVDWTLEWMSHEVLQKGDDFHLWGPQNREVHYYHLCIWWWQSAYHMFDFKIWSSKKRQEKHQFGVQCDKSSHNKYLKPSFTNYQPRGLANLIKIIFFESLNFLQI